MKDDNNLSGQEKGIKWQRFATSSHARTGVKSNRQQEGWKNNPKKKNKGTRFFVK